jgi:hypothetical protein
LFERTLNNAFMKTASGAFSIHEAVSDACNELAKEGIDYFDYRSGRRIETRAAVLMNLRTAVNQAAAQITEEGCKLAGVEYVETSAHTGARTHPSGDYRDHSLWQGKLFKVNSWEKASEAGKTENPDTNPLQSEQEDDKLYYTTPTSGTYPTQSDEEFERETRELIEKEYPKTLDTLHQDRHIAGTEKYDPTRSELTEDPQMLLDLYAGKGSLVKSNSGKWAKKERFEHNTIIGIWRNNATGEEAPTNRGMIHYSKKRGLHIVPSRPDWENRQ